MLLVPGYGTVITRTVRTLAQRMAAVVALAPVQTRVQTPLPVACGRARTRVTASPDAAASTVGHGATRLAPAGAWWLGTAVLPAATKGPRP